MTALPFFFYGTLLDMDVLAAVTGRRIGPSARRAADVFGWRRLVRAYANYPVLIPAEDGQVDGMLVSGLGSAEVLRLIRFEGDDYELGEIGARPRGGVDVRARVFLPLPHVPASSETWSFTGWRRRHKTRYLQRLRRNLSAD